MCGQVRGYPCMHGSCDSRLLVLGELLWSSSLTSPSPLRLAAQRSWLAWAKLINLSHRIMATKVTAKAGKKAAGQGDGKEGGPVGADGELPWPHLRWSGAMPQIATRTHTQIVQAKYAGCCKVGGQPGVNPPPLPLLPTHPFLSER